MNDMAARVRCPPKHVPELWQSIPFELALSALAVILAGALHLVGLMP